MKKQLMCFAVVALILLPSACAKQNNSWRETAPLAASEDTSWKNVYLSRLKALYREKKRKTDEAMSSADVEFALVDYNRDGVPELLSGGNTFACIDGEAVEIEVPEFRVYDDLPTTAPNGYFDRSNGKVHWFYTGYEGTLEVVFDPVTLQATGRPVVSVWKDDLPGGYYGYRFYAAGKEVSKRAYNKARANWIKTYQPADELTPYDGWHSYRDEELIDDEITAIFDAWQPPALPSVTPCSREDVKPRKFPRKAKAAPTPPEFATTSARVSGETMVALS